MSAWQRLADRPHRRYNPLSGRWVLVSPHRALRPWDGVTETPVPDALPRHDPSCRLCPGNARVGGDRNPAYTGPFVFDNDFPALFPEAVGADDGSPASDGVDDRDPLFRAEAAAGRCRVVCLTPRHDLSMATMTPHDILAVIELWIAEYRRFTADPQIRHMQIFENRGAMMGTSNPHPHGQIWADARLPDLVRTEDRNQAGHLARHGRTLLQDYLARELDSGDRVVFHNDSFVAVVPYWAEWPYETLLAPRQALPSIDALDERQRQDFASALREMNLRFDRLFDTPFPYTMGIHQSPTDGQPHPHWHFHVHYFPPLLRSATVRKFMAGYEMLAMAQRDLTPEQAAERLRAAVPKPEPLP